MSHAPQTDLLVIGAGVLGLSIAAEAATRGVETLLVAAEERDRTAVSAASFACINVHEKQPEAYTRLHLRAIAAHHELDGRVGDGAAWLRIIGADFFGEHHADWGYVDVDAYGRAHSSALEAAGGRIRRGVRVLSITPGSGRAPVLVETTAGAIAAHRVAIAAGAGTSELVPGRLRTPRLAATAGLPGFLARVSGESPVDRVVVEHELSVRPDGPGRFAVQSLALEHEFERTGRRASAAAVRAPLAERIGRRYGLALREDAIISVDEAPRPISPDGLPVLGLLAPEIYVAITHSGVNLAPIIGRAAVDELLGTADADFAPFRPDAAPQPTHRRRKP